MAIDEALADGTLTKMEQKELKELKELKETLKNSLGIMTPVIEDCVPKEHQWKVFLSSRIGMICINYT